MIFTDFPFYIFFIITAVLYFIVPLKLRWMLLLIASLYFYGSSDIRYLPYILSTSLIIYGVSRFIQKNYDSGDEAMIKKNRPVLITGLVVVIGILIYSKFAARLLTLIAGYMGGDGTTVMEVLMPLGISYYTFASVSYMLDVYWKRVEAQKNPLKILLYLIYFPHILQGPIPKYEKLAPQLYEGHAFDYRRLCFGLQLILWGIFQKLVIADRLGLFVTPVFHNWQEYHGFVLLLATFFCAFQLYMDFSGCICMAEGMSEIFGITIEKNFKRPFFSQSVEEYWRRWHISLGNFFKDYLCMPIAVAKSVKKKSKEIRKKHGRQAGNNYITLLSVSAVWLCSGIWHGTGINYVLWGISQGVIILFSIFMEPVYKRVIEKLRINVNSKLWKAFRVVRTFILAAFLPKTLTMLTSPAKTLGFLKSMLKLDNFSIFTDGTIFDLGLDKVNFTIAIASLLVLVAVSTLQEKGIKLREELEKKNIAVRTLVYLAGLWWIILFGIYGSKYDISTFTYMNF